MAVERLEQFTINLGGLVRARLDSFVDSRKRIQARVESDFQRRITENDLSWQEQLDYRQQQLKEEQGKTYPDNNFIDELKDSVVSLKKLVKARRFRDRYFALLQDLASGKKSIEDHLEFLEDSFETITDQELKDQVQEEIVKATEAKRNQDKRIVDSQIAFYQQDRTNVSLNKAIDLVNSQLSKIEVQQNPEVRSAYELQLNTLNKEKLEIDIEDKMSWMVTSLISEERKNPSLWKLSIFGGFSTNAGIDMPINVGGVRYDSEQEYWQMTMNDYVQGAFAEEYIKENKRNASLIYNQLGLLPDTHLQNLVNKNQQLRTSPNLVDFQDVISSAIQGSIVDVLDLRAKDITSKYNLDKPTLVTTSDYQAAIKEIENLKTLFGEDYSLSPMIQQVETMLATKRYEITEDILSRAGDYAAEQGISVEEAIKIIGPIAEVEIPAETFIEKEPTEIAEEVVKVGKEKVPPEPEPTPAAEALPFPTTQAQMAEYKEKYTLIGGKWYEKAPTPSPVTPVPTPTPAPTPAPAPQITHTVKEGETLWGIAQRELGSGAKWTELKTPEGVSFTKETAKKLQIGQKLIIPPK